METQTLLMTVVVLFTLAALGGVAMAAMRFGANRNPPPWLAMGHGVLAAAGLTLLLFAVFTAELPALASLGALLLLVAALGGAALNLLFHWNGKLLPKGLLVGHALLAVAGYGALLLSMRA